MIIRRIGLVAVVAFAATIAGACGEQAKQAPVRNINTNATPTAGDSVKVPPKILKDEPGPDGSRIVVRQLENGDEVAIRKWDAGPVKKVTKRTKAGATRGIRVVFSDGKVVRVEDVDAVTHALDWTGAQLADVAKKTGKTLDAASDTSDDAASDTDEPKPKK
jgi:hypothetical protein